jgi:hypothetical protein
MGAVFLILRFLLDNGAATPGQAMNDPTADVKVSTTSAATTLLIRRPLKLFSFLLSACNGQLNACGDPDLGSPNELCDNAGPGVAKYDDAHFGQYSNCVPLGNVLVIDERGPNKPPDDASVGGKIRFNFDYPVDIHEICLLDVDGTEETYVSVYYDNEADPATNLEIPFFGDNGAGCFDISGETDADHTGVTKIVVKLTGSGSVTDLKYTMCNPNHGGGGGGDPHIKRWNRKHFSFHGGCDLVMLQSQEFHNFAGIDLHVRTTVQDWYSYIEMAALRVGNYLVEMHSQYITVDGVEYTDHDLPLTFGGEYKYVINAPTVEADSKFAGAKTYKVDLHDDSWITFKVYKEFIFIEVSGHEGDFADAVGLLGDYYNGNMVDRQGQRLYDHNQFGFEWQVRPETDKMLFSAVREPQFPTQCNMPTEERTSRRLRANSPELFSSAKEACANAADLDLCIDDVMAVGDVGIAAVW